ncbi:hypothetical protein [Actinomadura sp. HBU206391]|uniref:hypothetical protein n=1 Tax=Actinomadura sp. HBU206391 TaxID=2731692 RepID=UPI00164FDE3C|nr:hypothetical protein [Actinomadura sp. HBU206391]MBC6459709.1 hypothetical protein [Actinomadura sp. HBU206391]
MRYQLRESLSPQDVAAQVKLVRQCWRRARGQLKYRKLIDRLEAEHRDLAPVFAAAERGDAGPLRARLRGGTERTAQRRADAKARLLDAAGPLRLLSPGDLEAIARSSGFARAELEALLGAERVEVREPDALPASAPYQGYLKARESLAVLGHRHLADFLFGARLTGPMRVLGGFHAPDVRLDASVVAAVSADWARRPRDTSSTNAETVLVALRSALKDDTGDGARLAELVLYDLVDRLRERHRQRASDRALLRYAVDGLGIEPGEARRLVFAVLRETGPAGGLAGRLRELLDAGAAHAAALLAESALTAGDDLAERGAAKGAAKREAESAEVLATEARERVAAAVGLRDEAVNCADPDRAWRLLADALHLVRDLPGAEEHQRRLPPRPVQTATAVVDAGGTAVRLSWTESASKVGEIGYRVVRQRGRPPRDAADGEAVASSGTGAYDGRPPVNVPLFYAIVARRGDSAAAPAVAGPVVVRPEPAEVELVAGDGVVTGRWRCPPAAARVLVTRDEASVDLPRMAVRADRESFRDRVRNGTTYHYRVAAVYLDESGREVTTPGVRVSATPSAPPEPVGGFTAEPDPGDAGLLILGFVPPRHGTAEVVLLGGPPPWPYGSVVPLAEVRRAGRAVPATPTPNGLAVRPGASGVLLTVTVSGQAAAIGAHRRHVNLPPPRNLVAQRRGATVHIGFDWPDDVAEVELTYQVGDSDPRRTVITRAAYEAQGGVRLAAPENRQVDVLVASSGMGGDARVVGAPVPVTVPARALVDYDLERAGPPWRRTLVVKLRSDEPVRIERLLLVLREGRVMPQHPGDGDTVASWEELEVPVELSVPHPGRAGPFWLRCFAADGVIELSDPPVRRLQVKG